VVHPVPLLPAFFDKMDCRTFGEIAFGLPLRTRTCLDTHVPSDLPVHQSYIHATEADRAQCRRRVNPQVREPEISASCRTMERAEDSSGKPIAAASLALQGRSGQSLIFNHLRDSVIGRAGTSG
jgi:hypothetical protein